jgi:Threonine dehydrogenase and related Zn-dependent dehydrogenases
MMWSSYHPVITDLMQALVLTDADTFELEERPDPVPGTGEVLLDVAYVGLCGTDLHITEGIHPRARFPLVLGHEVVGIARGGEHAGRPLLVDPLIACGHCVACRLGFGHVCSDLRLVGIDRDGGLAGCLVADANRLHVVPGGVPLDLATLAEPLAVAIHTLRRSSVQVGSQVVVAGAGPVGLLVALVARRAGAAHVMVMEPAPERRHLAEQLGFIMLDPDDPTGDLDARTGGRLADVAFDAAAAAPVAALLTQLVRPHGEIMLVGTYGRPTPFDLQAVLFRELSIHGNRVYTPDDIDAALDLLAAGDFDVRPLLTGIVALDEAPAALRRLRDGTGVKYVVDCGGRS